ncbi:type II restriction endonuclease [Cellvibrio sp. KY-YJ-3]|uniref:type II restriction endonuclease n=1 Tax=Cellvibrio sp. KY-YJ-3 TaxID=454662 RepID=UPI0012482C49|nr:type II restriction endonuclease [Cellvibrio sp. KY-YJ-3]QEY11566.1 restriction endonuclease [Cellvibrio sp. KY-YJ-3]
MSDFGKLNDYIVGAAVKRLTAVECDPERSNGHEINAGKMKFFLGADARQDIPTHFIRLTDDPEDTTTLESTCSWWFRDRTNQGKGKEYRLYYKNNPAIDFAEIGDPLIVAMKHDQTLIFITSPKGSQSELELYEIFGDEFTESLKALDFSDNEETMSSTKRFILEELGFEIKSDFEKNYLEEIIKKFGSLTFPNTKAFSDFARDVGGSLKDFSSADEAIIKWWDTEEAMFRQLEGALIKERLSQGLNSVEEFLQFSQSIIQRRSSRAGHALENHLSNIFDASKISYSWGAITENKKRPDFLFPSITHYSNTVFPSEKLNMLGVKTTCKDRWRQVLTEANKITHKHLFTLQPKISPNQTEEMIASNLRLVIPKSIHSTYTEKQREWLLDFDSFLNIVKKNQA